MTSQELLQWRKRMGVSQRDAAKALGVAFTTYQEMERGRRFRDNRPAPINQRTELACFALEQAERGLS